ncbi:MAG: sigma-70 family RNA polymerase sigma factor [Planctomycetes bacterium]|nr:sigma-70 family RNA polymerase sigma factor [Planctomycetota bacterium]
MSRGHLVVRKPENALTEDGQGSNVIGEQYTAPRTKRRCDLPTCKTRAIQDLAKQLAFSPEQVRKQEIDRAEQLALRIDPVKSYPYEFICYQITGYRPRTAILETIPGELLRSDLVRMIESLSESLSLRVEDAGQPVLSIDDLCDKFKVTSKTISRWRKAGLVSRKFLFPDGKKRVGFLASSVEAFASTNPSRVESASTFSQLKPEERREIIRRARRLSHYCHCCLYEVSKRIARKMGRAVETVRYTIKKYDETHPDLKLFPNSLEQLNDRDREHMFRAFRRGVSVHALAKRYCRTRSSIYRIINEMRVEHLLREPTECIYNPEFDAPDADAKILGEEPQNTGARTPKPPPGLPVYLRALYRTPLLTKEQEQYLFRKYNYLKYRAIKLKEKLRRARTPKSRDIEEVERLLAEANQVKNRLVKANLRLVVNIAKRHIGSVSNFFELVSDGNISLMRAVEKFDYARGFKFSTYASWAVIKNYARTIPEENYRMDRFMTGKDELLEASSDLRFAGDEGIQELDSGVKESIEEVLEKLTPREREVIERRFGLGGGPGPQTLEEVGQRFGVTKERVRQIESKALEKLRHLIDRETLEATLTD